MATRTLTERLWLQDNPDDEAIWDAVASASERLAALTTLHPALQLGKNEAYIKVYEGPARNVSEREVELFRSPPRALIWLFPDSQMLALKEDYVDYRSSYGNSIDGYGRRGKFTVLQRFGIAKKLAGLPVVEQLENLAR